MTRGRAAKDLANALIAAADDDEPKLKQWFREADLRWVDFEGSAFNRVFKAITGKPAERIRQFVSAAVDERPDYTAILEPLLNQFLNLPGHVLSIESPADIDRVAFQGEQAPEYFEKIIGRQSTLLPIAFMELGLQRARAVARVVVSHGNQRETGTGFLVAGNWLITNHHVLPDESTAQSAVAEFNYEQTMGGLDRAIDPVRICADRGFKTSAPHDWTIVKLEGQPNEKYGAIPLEPAKVVKEDRAIIIQHPGGGPKQIGIVHNLVTYADDNVVQYLTDTLPGSSGAPVFNESWQLIALHHSGGWLREPGTKQKLWRNEGIAVGQILGGAQDQLSIK